jgi:hypothetical protein
LAAQLFCLFFNYRLHFHYLIVWSIVELADVRFYGQKELFDCGPVFSLQSVLNFPDYAKFIQLLEMGIAKLH